jgi:sugar phosphate isomerase/epimerase/type 1 glutamine amidotransferase
MRQRYIIYPATCFLWLGLFSAFSPAQPFKPAGQAGAFYANIPDSAVERIKHAIPRAAVVAPSQPRKLLVFNMDVWDGEIRKGHPSIPYANYMLQLMGRQTGAYETYFSNDTMVFESAFLNQFDAICFNNTVGVLFKDPGLRNNLLEYVYSGKGFFGIHAAGATFCQWPVYDQFPEYGEMLGGYENGGHPWKPHEWITLRLDDPSHPINRAFEGKGFRVSDEVFQFTEPYSRDNLRILLAIDTDQTDMGEERYILPERRADKDLAISWVRNYGRGRVFYTSLGHNAHINWNQKVLMHYLDGIQFVLGDLAAPATPSHKLTPAIKAREKLGWKLGLSAYTFKNSTLFETIDKAAALGLLYMGGLNVQRVSDEISGRFDHTLSEEELTAVRKKLLSAGVTLVSYYIHDIPNEEEACRQIFEFGRKMGIETFISEPAPEALDLIEAYCEEYHIKLAIHNHGKDISPVYWDPQLLLEVCHKRSPLIGACGDLGYWSRSGIDPLDAVQLLGDRLITLQVHDLDAGGPEGKDVAWGKGKVELDALFRYLAANGVKPALFGLEYSRDWHRERPEIEQSIAYFNDVCLGVAGAHPAGSGK